MRFGSWENPSSQLPLLAALRSEAASAQLDSCSGVKLKCTLQTFIHSCLELSVQLKSQDRCRVVMAAAFMWQCKVQAWCTASASHSSAEVASLGTQHLAQKLDSTHGKRQLFHMTVCGPWTMAQPLWTQSNTLAIDAVFHTSWRESTFNTT